MRCSGSTVARIKVVHGDTALTPYSTGTWGSRCAVMAGGAVAAACEELAAKDRRNRRASVAGAARIRSASTAATRVGAAAASVGIAEVARTWYLRPQDLPAGVAPRRAGGHQRLQGGARFRHVQLCRTRRAGGSRYGIGCGPHPRLRDRRGWRRTAQSDDRRRPGARRAGAGDRHRAVRGDAVRRRRPAARLHARRLYAAGGDRGAGPATRPHGDAVAVHDLRPEGHRRGRRDRSAGGDRQCGERRAAPARRAGGRAADHAAPRAGGDNLGPIVGA